MAQRFITWKEINERLDALHGDIVETTGRTTGVLRLYGVPRGGVIVAGLLATRFPFAYTVADALEYADVVVDDLVNTGHTFQALNTPLPCLALFRKEGETDWLVFPWERKDTDEDRAANVIRLLEHWGEDPKREGLRDTPNRFLKGMDEMLRGYKEDPANHLLKDFDLQDIPGSHYDEMIVSKGIPFVSFCEHHIFPFEGIASIAYIPGNGRVVGLSKLARCVDGFARRLQVQERLTRQISDAIADKLAPLGSVVLIEASHTCQKWRGVCKTGSMVTSALTGVFKTDLAARAEAFSILEK